MAEILYNKIQDKSKALKIAKDLRADGVSVADINNKKLGIGRWKNKEGNKIALCKRLRLCWPSLKNS